MIKKRVLNDDSYVNVYYSKNLKGHKSAQSGFCENIIQKLVIMM